MQDNLFTMFEMQAALQSRLGYDFTTMSTEEKVAYIKEYSLHLEHELHEMLAELPFLKGWKKYPAGTYDEEFTKAKQEYADMIHFMLNVGIALGLSADAIFDLYVDKNAINHQRQDSSAYKPCIGGTK